MTSNTPSASSRFISRAQALEQAHAELLLQRLEVPEDRGMVHAELGRRRAQAAVARCTASTVAGDFAITRSQWLIRGVDAEGRPGEVHHHGMEIHRRLPDGAWVFFIDHPSGADASRAVEAPLATES